jgi:NAD(P)-dependent dehydrogenase (short-subunit alcohol dehydrogenase family)
MTTEIQLPIDPTIPRRALVTGGAQRLGAAMVHALAAAGFDIALHWRHSESEAQTLAREIEAQGRSCTLLQADLADEAQTQSLIARAAPLGVLVNNASVFEPGDWQDTDRASWDTHLEPNLRAPFVLMQAFARALPSDAKGVIVNMLDQRVWSLTPHFVAYSLSKFGLWGLTQSMALALAPDIRVNAIGPGPALPSPRQSEAQFARQCDRLPLRQGTTPDEIGRALLAILALPSLTGQMLALDGGQHLQYGQPHAAAPEE